jgi:hypothetical protein
MPDIVLAAQRDWPAHDLPQGMGVLLRIHGALLPENDVLARWADDGRPLDLEIILPRGAESDSVLADIRVALDSAGIAPRHVIALPEAYLKSYQPSGPWPEGAHPADCVASIGTGVLTNFTELNRCPPQSGQGDYVTHANSAIVHDADDQAVLQTLEALPAIHASARAIAGTRAYRLGLMSIAMRTNPYGAGLSKNPERVRKTMTDDDPRQRTAFAATYAAGVTLCAARGGAEAVCLAATGGPFGLHDEFGKRTPLFQMVEALHRLSGCDIETDIRGGLCRLAGDTVAITANCAADPHEVSVSRQPLTMLSASGTDQGVDGAVTLQPGDCVISGTGAVK